MTPARASAVVGGASAVAALFVLLGLAVAGGPAQGRRDHRDAIRLDHLRELVQAFVCHAEARAAPAAPYRIERPEAGLVRACAAFESAGRTAERYPAWPPFDPATGCVTVSLARDPA